MGLGVENDENNNCVFSMCRTTQTSSLWRVNQTVIYRNHMMRFTWCLWKRSH